VFGGVQTGYFLSIFCPTAVQTAVQTPKKGEKFQFLYLVLTKLSSEKTSITVENKRFLKIN
jgi:hypothetical protein